MTEPAALRTLRDEFDDFRVFTSAANRSAFHLKAFVLDAMDGWSAFAALVGSGNLTGQGLGRNTEAAIAIQATGADATALVNTTGTVVQEVWLRFARLQRRASRSARRSTHVSNGQSFMVTD